MTGRDLDLESYYDPPSGWSTSLANVGELLLPCLDAVGARTVAEVGAFEGGLTRLLVDWAAARDARVLAIDPSPRDPLVELDAARGELELLRRTSLDALPEIPLPDAVIIDGDHNYWTVSQELRLIGERAPGAELPLLMFHDVCWPHARRDDYFDPDQIPAEHRHPVAGDSGGLSPGESGTRPRAMPYPRSAAREGGERNGVLTAVEDFAAAREGLRLVVVPAFFGFGVLFHEDAPAAEELARILDPFDRSSLLAALEANRVRQLAEGHVMLERLTRQEEVLRRLLESSAFALAERLSKVRAGAGIAAEQPVISRDQVRRALDD